MEWGAPQALHILPPPADGVLTLIGDGSPNPKRGQHNPLAQTLISAHELVFTEP
jgi:hypothetical protein